jgi:hypothetical protein
VKIPARLDSSPLAAVLLLAGCKSEPARVDALALSRLKPGHTRIEDLEAQLGPPTKARSLSAASSEYASTASWGPQYFDWIFYLRRDGTVQQFEPQVYTWTLSEDRLPGSTSEESQVPPYLSPKAVAPECAQLFVPGLTTQREVVAAWGPCSHALALPEDRYRIRWGSSEDSWCLEFEPDGLLSKTPRHVSSYHGR